MRKAYLSVICASLILADTCRYHTQLSMVASYIDMISVIFMKGKLLKLHAPMSIHATSISVDVAPEVVLVVGTAEVLVSVVGAAPEVEVVGAAPEVVLVVGAAPEALVEEVGTAEMLGVWLMPVLELLAVVVL